jgi:hypothetical protein
VVCVLCNAEAHGKLTREHVFPEWMRKMFVADEGERMVYRRGFQDRGEPLGESEWQDAPFNLRVKDLCPSCNNDWCSEIETEAQPILKPLIEGRPAPLDASQQATLAVWATKTLLMLQQTYPEDRRGIPPESHWWFRDHRWPLANEQIWITQYDGKGQWPIASHYYQIALAGPLAPWRPPPEGLNGHVASIAVGHLAFRMFGHTLDIGPIEPPGEPVHRELLTIWPATGHTIHFPPARLAEGDAGLRALVDSVGDASPFYPAEGRPPGGV